MLNYLRKKLVQKHITVMNRKIEGAFIKVNSDIRNMQAWINHIISRHDELDEKHHEHRSVTQTELSQLKKWINYLHRHGEELRTYIYAMGNDIKEIQRRQEELVEKLRKLEEGIRQEKETPRAVPKTMPKREEKTSFEERMIKTHIMPNRKSYVMQEIQKAIGAGKYSTKQVERMIVEEKKLCGRTTFYSHLRELRGTGRVKEMRAGNKLILMAAGEE
jgi:predicted  nucleic acid-binding Zn-ribbon protein